jgi:hypothetical protein
MRFGLKMIGFQNQPSGWSQRKVESPQIRWEGVMRKDLKTLIGEGKGKVSLS